MFGQRYIEYLVYPVRRGGISGMLAVMIIVAGAGAEVRKESGLFQNNGIFFGGSINGSLAWIDHAQVNRQGSAGAVFDLHFGWRMSSQLMVGGHYNTWGRSIMGKPVHLHILGIRFEYAPGTGGRTFDGASVSVIPGVTLIEGDSDARRGGAVIVSGGYRWQIGEWTTIGILAGIQGHLFKDGKASIPYSGLELRFHGSTQ